MVTGEASTTGERFGESKPIKGDSLSRGATARCRRPTLAKAMRTVDSSLVTCELHIQRPTRCRVAQARATGPQPSGVGHQRKGQAATSPSRRPLEERGRNLSGKANAAQERRRILRFRRREDASSHGH